MNITAPEPVPRTEAGVEESSKGTPKRVFLAGGLIALVALGVLGVVIASRGSSSGDRFVDAVQADSAMQFPTERAATLHGETVCEGFESTGDPKGGEVERLAVEYLCPEWADDFRLLQTATIEGTFEIYDIDDYLMNSAGAPCEGEGGYGDINSSTQVVVTNLTGDILTRTSLGEGRSGDLATCGYSFEITVTEGEEQYVVAVGRRGETNYTFEELRDKGIALSLGR